MYIPDGLPDGTGLGRPELDSPLGACDFDDFHGSGIALCEKMGREGGGVRD
jgi:hypothetical protein